MEAQWVADRRRLRTLLVSRPEWTFQDLADAIGHSLGWVKKWVGNGRMANDLTDLSAWVRSENA